MFFLQNESHFVKVDTELLTKVMHYKNQVMEEISHIFKLVSHAEEESRIGKPEKFRYVS